MKENYAEFKSFLSYGSRCAGWWLQAALVAEIAVLEAEEVEHTVETDGVDALLGVSHHARLGVECYAKTGFAEHLQIVGVVVYGYCVC